MISTTRKFLFFNFTIFIILTAFISGSLYFFYQNNTFNSLSPTKGFSVAQLEKFDSELESIPDAKSFFDLKEKSIVVNRVWETIISNQLFFDAELESKIEETKSRLNENINSLSHAIEKQQSFKKYITQINSFATFVSSNNWKTLTRISKRVSARSLNGLDNPKGFSYNLSLNLKDIDTMINVTLSSTLKQVDKDSIIAKLENNKKLTNNIFNTNQDIMHAAEKLKLFAGMQRDWIAMAIPSIASLSQKSEWQKQSLQYFFVILLTLMAFLGLTGFFFYRWVSRQELDREQRLMADSLNQIVLKNSTDFTQGYSEDFIETCNAIRNYIQKRMSYGHMFQDSLPFPALMLDDSLTVRWCNKHFSDTWGIDENIGTGSGLTWSDLIGKTNIEVNDPVVEASENIMSGIYQIQVKKSDEAESLSYQMYVCPMKVQGEVNMLLYFYPLMTLEETIKIQTESIVSPIEASLKAMLDDEMNSDFQKAIHNSFKVSSIENIHRLFFQVYDKQMRVEENFHDQITELEEAIQDLQKMISDVCLSSDEVGQYLGTAKDNLVYLKDDIVDVFTNTTYLYETSEKLAVNVKYLAENFIQLFNASKQTQVDFQKFVQSIPSFENLKRNIREAKQGVVAHKSIVNSSLKSLKQQIERYEVKDKGKMTNFSLTFRELSKLPQFFHDHEKFLTQIDVFLSKIMMLFEDTKKITIANSIDNDLLQIKKMYELSSAHQKELISINHDLGKGEQKVVKEMRELFQSISTCSKEQKNIHSIVSVHNALIPHATYADNDSFQDQLPS